MPFITKDELGKLSGSGGEIKTIAALGDPEFDALEIAAAEIIVTETGFPNPVDVADAPAWAKLPAAWIMFSIFITDQSAPTSEMIQSSKQAWDRAMQLLGKHSAADTTAVGIAKTGLIEGMYYA